MTGPIDAKPCRCGGLSYLWPNATTGPLLSDFKPVRVCTDCEAPEVMP